MRSFVICALLLTACRDHVDADFSDNLKVVTLPAETYQKEITAIDRLVFADQPLGAEGVRSLESTIGNLSDEVGRFPNSKFLKLESLELKLLAKRAGRLSPEGTGHELQDNWMRIRSNVFEDRAWFARSAADLEPVSSTGFGVRGSQFAVRPAKAAAVEPAIVERRDALTGRWKVESMLANGQPRQDDEMSGSVWSFDPPRLVISNRGRDTIYNCVVHRDDLAVTTPAGEEGSMRYELGNGGLRIAFYDGLKGKPETFEPEPGRTDPLLVVVHLTPVH